jgi:CheY-like chemotaxis protein
MDRSFRDPLTILVVEDDAPVRAIAVEHLELSGYGVLEAISGEAALSFLEAQHAIDVVFTDIRLGGRVTGWDVGEAFRAKNPVLPIIYTSGYLTMPPRTVRGGLFITKPYQPAQIVEACTRLVSGRS